MLREAVTTALDTLGLLLLAAGATAAAWRYVGPIGLAAGGLVVLGGSWWFAKPPAAKRSKDGSR